MNAGASLWLGLALAAGVGMDSASAQDVDRRLPPSPGESRFRAGEVLVAIAPETPAATVARILRTHRLTETKLADVALPGSSIRLWRISDGRSVASVVRELAGEPALTRIQPNYIYELN